MQIFILQQPLLRNFTTIIGGVGWVAMRDGEKTRREDLINKSNLLCGSLKYKPAILNRKLKYTAMLFHDMSDAFCAKAMPLFF